MNADNKLIFDNEVKSVNKALAECKYLENSGSEAEKVISAEAYALSAGGKRIRPVLCMEFYKLFGGRDDIADIAACLELSHTFSLIHDDMPEMDNDDLRRGKPSCHIAYGADVALLAGDGLSLLPFEMISDFAAKGVISAETAIKLVGELSKASGSRGMIMGQMLDIYSENTSSDIDFLTHMSSLKTGCLLKAACRWGAILAGADDNGLEVADAYAENIGLAFQIVDDVLDVTGDEQTLGKPIGSDMERKKDTFASLLGADAATMLAETYTKKAIESVVNIEGSSLLVELAFDLLNRNK